MSSSPSGCITAQPIYNKNHESILITGNKVIKKTINNPTNPIVFFKIKEQPTIVSTVSEKFHLQLG